MDVWEARMTGTLSTDGTAKDVPGTELTLDVVGPEDKFLIIGTVDAKSTNTGTAVLTVHLWIDGAQSADPTWPQFLFQAGGQANDRKTIHQQWILTGLTAGTHTLKYRTGAAAAGIDIFQNHTRYTVVRLAGARGPEGPPGEGGGTGGGDTDWTPLGPLQNNWVGAGSPWGEPSYRKTSAGTVIFRGSIKSGALNGPVFTMPAGYRPGGDCFIPIASNTNGAFIGAAKFTSAGVLSIVAGSTALVSLDGMTYYADL